jgi:hypothetical protein
VVGYDCTVGPLEPTPLVVDLLSVGEIKISAALPPYLAMGLSSFNRRDTPVYIDALKEGFAVPVDAP